MASLAGLAVEFTTGYCSRWIAGQRIFFVLRRVLLREDYYQSEDGNQESREYRTTHSYSVSLACQALDFLEFAFGEDSPGA